MGAIAGIIFGMDGVLCDSEAFIAEAAGRMFAETYRTKVQPADFEPFVGTGEDRYLGGVAQKYGITLTMPRDKDRTYAIYLELIRGRLKPLPGAREFVDQMRRRGIKLAVATSADNIKMEGNLREIGMPPETFDAVVTGSEVARKKPAPDIFLTAAARLGLSPARCLVVEDAPSGIIAAKSAGARTLGIMSSFSDYQLRAAGAEFLAKDLANVLDAAIA